MVQTASEKREEREHEQRHSVFDRVSRPNTKHTRAHTRTHRHAPLSAPWRNDDQSNHVLFRVWSLAWSFCPPHPSPLPPDPKSLVSCFLFLSSSLFPASIGRSKLPLFVLINIRALSFFSRRFFSSLSRSFHYRPTDHHRPIQ